MVMVQMQNNYRLLPHAKMLYWLLIIMEQSTPHTTLLASNSMGKHTCCGELCVSWVPNPRRPAVKTRDEEIVLLIRCCQKPDNNWRTSGEQTEKRLMYCTIFSSSPGKYFSLIGHCQDVGRSAWHLDQLIAEERLDNLRLKQRQKEYHHLYPIKILLGSGELVAKKQKRSSDLCGILLFK